MPARHHQWCSSSSLVMLAAHTRAHPVALLVRHPAISTADAAVLEACAYSCGRQRQCSNAARAWRTGLVHPAPQTLCLVPPGRPCAPSTTPLCLVPPQVPNNSPAVFAPSWNQRHCTYVCFMAGFKAFQPLTLRPGSLSRAFAPTRVGSTFSACLSHHLAHHRPPPACPACLW
jgi:hypothetical protein